MVRSATWSRSITPWTPATLRARATASGLSGGVATPPVSVTSPPRASISIREPDKARLTRRALATESAVIWFGLATVPWPNAAEAVTARRPTTVEIRFSPTIMGYSFSRMNPTRAQGERRAGRVVRVGVWSVVTVDACLSERAAGTAGVFLSGLTALAKHDAQGPAR